MPGIYIHIPFCKKRCIYCDFYSTTRESQREAYVAALCREIRLRKEEADGPIETLYFGGGTPTRLQQADFERIFETIADCYILDPAAEITVEANPDDLSDRYVEMLSGLPFNRISIGIQSFNDRELQFLSRRHTARQAVEAVQRCRERGFHNIGIDLMYGLPGQTQSGWLKNIREAIRLEVPHISAYHLIYEERTRIYTLLQRGIITAVDEESSSEMFAMLIDTLSARGFIHYEISAFAKEGFFSRHNSSYWKGVPYLGFGPSAHSYNGNNRSYNPAFLSRYISAAIAAIAATATNAADEATATIAAEKATGIDKAHKVTHTDTIAAGILIRETDSLTLYEKYNEFILTGLRTMWGVNLSLLEERFGAELYQFCMENAKRFREAGLLVTEGDSLKLTREGIFISDGIMSELMWV